MAKRPVFIAKKEYPYFEMVEIEFEYFNGFAVSQKQKSIKALHKGFVEIFPDKKVLEVSTKSINELGISLSAFNLKMSVNGKVVSLECVFQGSKKFEKGGPYTDIMELMPWEAKKDKRLKESGELKEFILNGQSFSNEPKDLFYNGIYFKALSEQTECMDKLIAYDAFTDIEFNPKKSLNCQAKALAIATGLIQAGLWDLCLVDRDQFLRIVYRQEQPEKYEQMSLFSIAM